MCLAAIEWARLERLGFAGTREGARRAGFDDERLYNQLALPPEQRSLPTFRDLAAEGDRPFELWLANDERTHY